MSSQSSYWMIATCLSLCVAAILAASVVPTPTLQIPLVAAGVLGALVLFRWSKQLSTRAQLEKQQRDAERLEVLKREFSVLATPVEIKGSTGLALSLFLILFAAVTVYVAWRGQDIEAIILACFLMPLALFMTLAAVPLINKPIITIQRDGIDTPAYGFILWREIDHISLQALNSKGPPVPHLLRFNVPALEQRINRAHPVMRLLYRLRPRAQRTTALLRLSSTSESPIVVHELCLHLWTKATAKTA